MIKRFAQCLREYKWTALVSPVCMIGEVAMEVTIPLVMADLYDYGIAMSNMAVVWQKALQLLLCALASLLFGCLSADYASKAATGFARNLRHDMYYRVQDFSFSNIDKFSSASIVTRLTSDVATIQMAFQMMIRMAIRCPMMLDSRNGILPAHQPEAQHRILHCHPASGACIAGHHSSGFQDLRSGIQDL